MVSFVIVFCDALRPDHVCPELMPRLTAFRDRSTSFARHRAVFPSDTRANVASLVTGAPVSVHGIIGNAVVLGSGRDRRLIDTGDYRALRNEQTRNGGHFITATALVDHLANAGRTLAIISSASSGATELLGIGKAAHPVFQLNCHDLLLGTPGPLRDAIECDLGPPPLEASPDIVAVDYGVAAFVNHIWPTLEPDCSVLWFNEPDVSYHDLGPAEADDILRDVDVALGILIDWWEAEGRARGVNLLIASDHGQRPVKGATDIGAALRALGLRVGDFDTPDIDFELISGGFGQIHVRDDGARLEDAAQALQSLDDIALLFSPAPDLPSGVLPAAAALIDHPRCPDLLFTLAGDTHGGGTSNRGAHGGATAMEMTAFLAAGGSLFPEGRTIEAPTNTTDLMPTILEGLGISFAPDCRGWPLSRLFGEPAWRPTLIERTHRGRRRLLMRFESGSRIIVDQGFVEFDGTGGAV